MTRLLEAGLTSTNLHKAKTPARDGHNRPIVVVTGMGVITSLGQGKTENWMKITAGESGIGTIRRFSTHGLKTRIAGTGFESKGEAIGKDPQINHFIDSSGGGQRIWICGLNFIFRIRRYNR